MMLFKSTFLFLLFIIGSACSRDKPLVWEDDALEYYVKGIRRVMLTGDVHATFRASNALLSHTAHPITPEQRHLISMVYLYMARAAYMDSSITATRQIYEGGMQYFPSLDPARQAMAYRWTAYILRREGRYSLARDYIYLSESAALAIGDTLQVLYARQCREGLLREAPSLVTIQASSKNPLAVSWAERLAYLGLLVLMRLAYRYRLYLKPTFQRFPGLDSEKR